LTTPAQVLQEFFPLFDLHDAALKPRYNLAPTQTVLAVRQVEAGQKPRGVLLRWGLIPSWADEPNMGSRLINARADTAATKPAFRAAFKHRRCLILADGFFEWQRRNKHKQPYHIRLRDGRPFAFAGLWEHWGGADPPVESCTIMTTDANEAVMPLHDRMPLILPPEVHERWLDPEVQDRAEVESLMKPYPSKDMILVPVSQRVNNVRNDDPECVHAVAPTPAAPSQRELF